MITEAKFKYALKEMMQTQQLENINVTALCKKCGVHRQTFYYHYQDIYDLIAAIFLNEDLSELEAAKDVKGVLRALLRYVFNNFSFLCSTYNSAARDLTDDFLFGKLNAKLFGLWNKDKSLLLQIEGVRSVSRRFAHFVSDEYGHCFRDPQLTPESFQSKMTRFNNRAIEMILPSLIELSRQENGIKTEEKENKKA